MTSSPTYSPSGSPWQERLEGMPSSWARGNPTTPRSRDTKVGLQRSAATLSYALPSSKLFQIGVVSQAKLCALALSHASRN